MVRNGGSPTLITDVKLPEGIDGWQIAERCREDGPNRPVIYAICFSPSRPRWRIQAGF
ncbi:hypothetical protein [Bradyrhizobium yuanmingense]|uniref:hypothetical protein n=1 Tax=Bradyrhizobium yuanmingense TaxID=108015 RepID=UPI0023B88D76|nr:hypothetical protein [Bradyrhizobium yuanmingense]MDF0582325.1 hypothetical protein [Bradyrhizobium yuanmingense]